MRNITQRDDGEPTEPKLPAQQGKSSLSPRLLRIRKNQRCMFALDEQGGVTIVVKDQGTLRLRPEDGFDLLDFLFEARDFLVARSVEKAEQ